MAKTLPRNPDAPLFHAGITNGAISHSIESGYNEGLSQFTRDGLAGALTVLTSNFAKGALAVAAVAVVGGAALVAGAAMGGPFAEAAIRWVPSGIPMNPIDGLVAGVRMGLGALGSNLGLGMMVGAGITTAYTGWRAEQNEINASKAKAEERKLAKELQKSLSLTPAPGLEGPGPDAPAPNASKPRGPSPLPGGGAPSQPKKPATPEEVSALLDEAMNNLQNTHPMDGPADGKSPTHFRDRAPQPRDAMAHLDDELLKRANKPNDPGMNPAPGM